MEDTNSEAWTFLSTLGDTNALRCISEKHPFQIDSLPGTPYQLTRTTLIGFYARLDLPGVPPKGLKFFKKPDNRVVTFSARAPKKEGFPLDESERVYAGFLRVNRNPLVIPIRVFDQNGCFFMHFPDTDGSLFSMPPPKSGPDQTSEGSAKSAKGEGSCSGKSIDEAQGSGKSELVKILSQVSAEGSEKAQQDEGSSEKSIHKPEGSVKSGSGEISPNQSAEGSAKLEQGEGSSSGQPIDKAEGSGKPRSSKSSSNKDDEAWILACIKRNILRIDEPEPPKDESVSVETSLTEQSSHEVPEIAIGSVKECGVHGPECQCQRCDSSGIYLKLWSTTEDIIRYMNKLKIKGPDGVCEKRVVQEDGLYSLYLRADLPGLEPSLCVTTVRDRCILVYGKPQPQEQPIAGARNYLFFVQLRCSCCKFHNLHQDHGDGVLRMFCKIIGLGPGPSAD